MATPEGQVSKTQDKVYARRKKKESGSPGLE